MRSIDQESWPRKDHFRLYSGLGFPHVNICVQLDVTEFWANRARVEASPTVALVYAVTKAANRTPELRQRIRDGRVVEHEVIHPSVTVMGNNDLFGLVTLTYHERFETFAAEASEGLMDAEKKTSLSDFPSSEAGEPVKDDLISISILPWLAFTSFSITRKPEESVPLLALGKVQPMGERFQLPFFVNFHHALADGLHIARFVKHAEEETRALSRGANRAVLDC